MKKTNKIYFNKGVRRKQQIYNWLGEVIINNGLTYYTDKIKTYLYNSQQDKAYNTFADLIFYIISNRPANSNGDTLGYLFHENIKRFGQNIIIQDLYTGILKELRIKKPVKKEKLKIKKTTIKEIEKEIEPIQEKKYRLGITTEKTKEKATIRQRKNGIFYLQSQKTGKILAWTPEFRKELKQLKSDKK